MTLREGQLLYAPAGHEFSLYYFQMDSAKATEKSPAVVAAEAALSAQSEHPVCTVKQCTVCPRCCSVHWDLQMSEVYGYGYKGQSKQGEGSYEHIPKVFKWGGVDGATDPALCAQCVRDECDANPEPQISLYPAVGITWNRQKFPKSANMNSFGGSCACAVEDWAVECECAGHGGDMFWSICGLGLCNGTGLTNNGGTLACAVGLNQCLSTYRYAARVARLKKMGAGPLANTTVQTMYMRKVKEASLITGGVEAMRKNRVVGVGIESPLLGATHNVASIITVVSFFIAVILEREALASFKWLTSSRALSLMVLSAVYVDVLSGLLHIVLDNPTITHWPLIGPECETFQGHHVAPNDIAKGSWLHHLCTAHFVNAILAATLLFNRTSSTARQFMVFGHISSTWMMAAHRLAHTHPRDVWWWADAMQRTGLLISPAHHSEHHITYTTNFAILSGWCNPFL